MPKKDAIPEIPPSIQRAMETLESDTSPWVLDHSGMTALIADTKTRYGLDPQKLATDQRPAPPRSL